MRVLICSLAGHGFVYPMVRIAKALERAGDAVAFVTGMEYGPFLADEGFDRMSRGPSDGPSFEIKWWGQALSIAIQVKHVEYALRRFGADAIVTSHLTHGPLIVGERLGIPVCVVGGARYLYRPGPNAIATDVRPPDARGPSWHYDEHLRIYDEGRECVGVAPARSRIDDPATIGDAFLLRAVPALVPPDEPLPQRVRLLGPCLWEPAARDPVLDGWLHADRPRPLAYVQLGRSFDKANNWPTVSAVLRDLGYRAAVASARFDMDVEPSEYEPDFFIRPHLLQGQVLPSCDLVVATGHPTASLGALCAGTPLVLLPNGSGTYDFAAMCTGANVAVALDGRTLTEAALTSAIERALQDDAIRKKAREVKASLEAFDSDRVAVDAIHQMRARRDSGRSLNAKANEISA